MELKALCQHLNTNDASYQSEINSLTQGVMELCTQLEAVIPNTGNRFGTLANVINENLCNVRRQEVNVEKYFSANGPIAKRIKEHLVIHEFISGGGRLFELDNALAMFDFSPTNDSDLNKKLNDFLSTIRNTVQNNQLFSTTLPTLHLTEYIQPAKMKTGIYGDACDPKSLTTILRTESPMNENMEILFIAPSEGSCTLWYYHPWEEIWINADYTWTFEGVLEKVQAEFQKALTMATPLQQDFDFHTELKHVEQLFNGVFDNEDHLPKSVFNIGNRLTVSPPCAGEIISAAYHRSSDDSYVSVKAHDINLIFRNTKGAYPSRNFHFTDASFTSRVDASQLHRTIQTVLIQRAYSAAKSYNDLIAQQKAQNV